MRIGVLTGGGDCPGLNAVIRAIVRKGIQVHGHDFVGFRDGWRGPMDADIIPLDVEAVRGLLPRGGTVLGSSRTNPYKVEGGLDRIKATVEALESMRCRHRGRRHPWGGQQAAERRWCGSSASQDDRQRPRRDRLHLRLRHRGQHRHRSHRPAAHDGRKPPPGADLRGHGPSRRVDRAVQRDRRRRQRHPDPGAARSTSTRSPTTSARFATTATPRSSWSRKVPSRRKGRSRSRAEPRRLRPCPPGRHRAAAGAGARRAHRPRGARHRARSHPARRIAHRVRPRLSTRFGLQRWTPSPRAGSADDVASGHRDRPGADRRGDRELKLVTPELYAEAEVFFG